MARKPIRGQATKKETGKSCPYCRFPIKERDEVVACGECGTPHHEDCWDDNGGCAVQECAGFTAQAKSTGSKGSHVPPTAGPSRKKVTLDPRPTLRRRKQERTKKAKSPEAKDSAGSTTGKSSKTTLWIVGATVAFIAVIGAIMIANNFDGSNSDSGQTCEDGTGTGGVPCYNNGLLPNVSQAEMNSQVTGFMRKWFRDIKLGDYYYAWTKLSPRVRKQVKQEIGYGSWMNQQDDISRYLEANSVRASFAQPSFPDEGVLSIRLSPMRFTKPGDRCGTRGGVTWVKWDPKANKWFYEPGVKVTAERRRAWGYRNSELFTYRCR